MTHDRSHMSVFKRNIGSAASTATLSHSTRSGHERQSGPPGGGRGGALLSAMLMCADVR